MIDKQTHLRLVRVFVHFYKNLNGRRGRKVTPLIFFIDIDLIFIDDFAPLQITHLLVISLSLSHLFYIKTRNS